MEEQLFIEKERIPVIIGKEGSMKKKIEEKFHCSLAINSETGELTIQSENTLDTFLLQIIVTAINNGHNPEHALLLEDENMVFDSIDVKAMIKDHKRLKIVMGRIIGKNGSTRKTIEEITKCHISVSDHIVSIIGPYENVQLVHEALEMLISGGSHKSFYSYLERNKIDSQTGYL